MRRCILTRSWSRAGLDDHMHESLRRHPPLGRTTLRPQTLFHCFKNSLTPIPFIPHAEHSDTPRLVPASPCKPCARHVCCTYSLICSSFKTCYSSDQFQVSDSSDYPRSIVKEWLAVANSSAISMHVIDTFAAA